MQELGKVRFRELDERCAEVGGVPESISVIVSTYNRPNALDAVLRGLAAQADEDFEIIVADDGSTSETAELIAAWRPRVAQEVRHVWHPDEGFRLAAIRNRAIEATHCPYLIFLDGDCIPPRHFVANHRQLAEPGWFVTGSRILLKENLTRDILQKHIRIEDWGFSHWLIDRLRGRIDRMLPTLNLPTDGSWRRRSPRRITGARGCNIAFWRKDLLRVGGFDAAFEGWGYEDTDLIIRLMRCGIFHKSGRFAVTVFHLWHKPDPSAPGGNQRLIRELESSSRIAAMRGIGVRSDGGL